MSSNLSSKQLRYVSMITSLFLGLKKDLGLNPSATKDGSSFLKCHITRIFLPYSSNSVFNFARLIFLAVGTNFKPSGSNEISGAATFLLERFTTFLLTNLSYKFTPICEAMFYKWIYIYIYIYIYSFSTLENTDENKIFFIRSPHYKHFGKAQHLVLWALWWHQLFSTR